MEDEVFTETPSSASPTAAAPVRLLIVEDNPLDVQLYMAKLNREGLFATVDVVGQREEFEKKLRENSYDLILTDYYLPQWRGTDVILTLKRMGMNTPVIVVTGSRSEDTAWDCLSLGATDLVMKDHLVRLPVAIRRALREEQMRAEFVHAREDLARINAELSAQVTELRRMTEETALIRETSDLMQACISPEEAYLVIRQAAERMFPTESGGLSLLNASRNLLEGAAVWGSFHEDACTFPFEDCWAARRCRIQDTIDLRSGLVCKHLGTAPAPGSLCVPVVAQGEFMGLVQLRPDDPARLTVSSYAQVRQTLASRFAERIGLTLANLRLREKLRMQSIRDPLTGLYNRRYMQESFDREFRRAIRNGRPISIIMLDVDHFKQINDTFGHDAGDAILSRLGAFLRQHVRAEDIACRCGGEEFSLIMPEAPLETAIKRAEDLLGRVRNLNLTYRERILDRVTISAGIASYPEHAGSTEELIRVADQALYRAKGQGRDRVIVAEISQCSQTVRRSRTPQIIHSE
jgi:diguanylate cyclase (GGDEF)-like protein